MSRRWILRVFAFLTVCFVVLSGGGEAFAARPKSSDDAALARATREWKALSADSKRRQFRDRWEQVISTFEQIGRSKASPSVRAQALHQAGRAAEDLHRISAWSKDLRRAEAFYREAIQLKSPNAKESLAKVVAIEKPKPVEPKLVAAPPVAKSAAGEAEKDPAQLVSATQAWRHLQQTSAKSTNREPWLEVIHRLEVIGDEFAPDRAGALGYFRAARAAEDLYKRTKVSDDAKRAIELFERVPEKCPESFLNDDALIAAAELEAISLDDVESARAHLLKAIALKGDSTDDAQKALEQLGDESDDAGDDESDALIAPSVIAEAKPVVKAEPAAPVRESKPAVAAKVSEEAAPELKRIRKALIADPVLSLSEEVGLKVKRIVIDAGHGGKDVGATGPNGVHEKDVTLAIARKLAASLKSRGYEVVLTRESDEYVSLEERAEAANQERGDLFVSIHANAHPSRKQSGVETYSLNVASNRFSKRLAARENATSSRTISDAQYLLADLATRSNTIDSDRLATRVQAALVEGVAKKFSKPKDHGVKHALFYVLLGAKMPAVLVETAFLSNPTEEKRLASAAYQTVVADSIAKGIEQFVARRGQLASADP